MEWKDEISKKTPPGTCHPIAGVISMCTGGNIVRNCPASKWSNTEECNALKISAGPFENCLKKDE